MCVTNTTARRLQAVSFPVEHVAGGCPSVLSQRLMSNFSLPQDGAIAMPRPGEPVSSETIYTDNVMEKPRPKRRRKPQKPGKTAKLNDRHFVEHNYHDHSADAVDDNDASSSCADFSEEHRRRGGVAIAFPEKLHEVLQQVENDGLAHIVSWQPHGRCFVVHKPKEFVDLVMPRYFRQTKLTSFQRQLNLYGFNRLTRGLDAGGYYHELFLRHREFLCKRMVRIKVKGTKFKAASSPDQEPDFYKMPPVSYVTPNHSDEDASSHDSSMRGHHNHSQRLSAAVAMQQLSHPNAVPVQSFCYQTQPPMAAASLYQPYGATSSAFLGGYARVPQLQADSILDQAVDELFMGEIGSEDNLADFVNEWADSSFGAVLADDIQLGYMLEKLLED